MDQKDIAETVYYITQRTLANFIKLSRKCGIEDKITEQTLVEMIVNGFNICDDQGKN